MRVKKKSTYLFIYLSFWGNEITHSLPTTKTAHNTSLKLHIFLPKQNSRRFFFLMPKWKKKKKNPIFCNLLWEKAEYIRLEVRILRVLRNPLLGKSITYVRLESTFKNAQPFMHNNFWKKRKEKGNEYYTIFFLKKQNVCLLKCHPTSNMVHYCSPSPLNDFVSRHECFCHLFVCCFFILSRKWVILFS